MIERIIQMSSDEGDRILDPYAGSGTTLVASRNLNRKGIGIDIDKRYEKIMKKRIQNETVNLFNP
jgi:DNA modification methylase